MRGVAMTWRATYGQKPQRLVGGNIWVDEPGPPAALRPASLTYATLDFPGAALVLSAPAPSARYVFCHSNTDALETFRTFTISSAETPFSSASHADRRSSYVALRPLIATSRIVSQTRPKSRNLLSD
jgi:hypothetical protein